MKAYANKLAAVAAFVPGCRQPRFRRRAALQLERMARRVATHLPSRRRGLRRWLPLGH